MPGSEKAATIDAEGHMALGVLRALGLPETVLAVQGVSNSPGGGHANSAGVRRGRKRAGLQAWHGHGLRCFESSHQEPSLNVCVVMLSPSGRDG